MSQEQNSTAWQHIYCLQRVISYTAVSLKKLVELGTVSSNFRESMEFYGAPIIQMLFENAQLPVWKNLPQLFSLLCRQKNHNLFWLVDEILKAAATLDASQSQDLYERLIFEAGPFGSYNSIETCVVQDNVDVLRLLLQDQELIVEKLLDSEAEKSKIHYNTNNNNNSDNASSSSSTLLSTQPPLLFLAVEKGSVKCLQFLLETVKLPIQSYYETKSSSPRSLLHHGLYHNASFEIFKVLFEVGKIASPGSESFINTPWSFHDEQGRRSLHGNLAISAHTALSLAMLNNRTDVLDLFAQSIGNGDLKESELLLLTFTDPPPHLVLRQQQALAVAAAANANAAPLPTPATPPNPLLPEGFEVPVFNRPQNSNLPPPPPTPPAPAAPGAAAPQQPPAQPQQPLTGEALGVPTPNSIAFIALAAGNLDLLKKFLQLFPGALQANLSVSSSTHEYVSTTRTATISHLLSKLFPNYAQPPNEYTPYGGYNPDPAFHRRKDEELEKCKKQQVEDYQKFKKFIEILVDNGFILVEAMGVIFTEIFTRKHLLSDHQLLEFTDYVLGVYERNFMGQEEDNNQNNNNNDENDEQSNNNATLHRLHAVFEFASRCAPTSEVLSLFVEKYKHVFFKNDSINTSFSIPLKYLLQYHSRYNNPVHVHANNNNNLAAAAPVPPVSIRDRIMVSCPNPVSSSVLNLRGDHFGYLINDVSGGLNPVVTNEEEWKYLLHFLACATNSRGRGHILHFESAGYLHCYNFREPLPLGAQHREENKKKRREALLEDTKMAEKERSALRRLFFSGEFDSNVSQVVNRLLSRDEMFPNEPDFNQITQDISNSNGAVTFNELRISMVAEKWNDLRGNSHSTYFPSNWAVSPLMCAIASRNFDLVVELCRVKELDFDLAASFPDLTPEEQEKVERKEQEANFGSTGGGGFGFGGGGGGWGWGGHSQAADPICRQYGLKTPLLLFCHSIFSFFVREATSIQDEYLQTNDRFPTNEELMKLGRGASPKTPLPSTYPITLGILETLLKNSSKKSNLHVTTPETGSKTVLHLICDSLREQHVPPSFARNRRAFYPILDQILEIVEKNFDGLTPENALDGSGNKCEFEQSKLAFKKLYDEFLREEKEEAEKEQKKKEEEEAKKNNNNGNTNGNGNKPTSAPAATNAWGAAKTTTSTNAWSSSSKPTTGGAAKPNAWSSSSASKPASKNPWSSGGK